MARKAIPNDFQKYWHPEPKDWHENIIGVYHVSSVGCDHQDLDFDDHSGPCLRSTFWNYTDPLPDSDETIGNLEEGNDHHTLLQKKIKEWKPNTIIEYPLAVILTRTIDGKTESILFVGSIDVLYKHLFNLKKDLCDTRKEHSIWDIKTASYFTLPKGRYHKNPTHFDQVDIYGHMLMLTELNSDYNILIRKKIIYVNKINKGTYVQREKFDYDKAFSKYRNTAQRCWYLHDCLKNLEVPDPEPMHWCRLCKYLSRCLEQGDVEPVKYKSGKLKGLAVIKHDGDKDKSKTDSES